jgi:ribose transport system permease protein
VSLPETTVTSVRPPSTSSLRDAVARLGVGRYAGVAIGLLVICVVLAIAEPVFLTWSNWQNILRAQSVVFALAIGMTLVVLTGGIDLSIASITVTSGMTIGLAIQHGLSAPAAMAIGIGAGLLMGLLNGLMIGVARIPFFVVTLGTLAIYESFALLTTDGATISLFSQHRFDPVVRLANDNIGPVPIAIAILAGLYLFTAFVLHFSPFGRAIYALGSNPRAARLTGIDTTRTLIAVYLLSGVFAGVGAVLQTGRLTAAGPQVDPNLMLTVIAAVLIGGTAFTGGEGGLLGTVIGVLFLGVIQNGLSLSNVSTFWQGTVSGLILICAVGIGVLRDRGWKLPRARQAESLLHRPGGRNGEGT